MAITNYLVHFKTEDTYNDKKSELRDDAVAFVKDATIIHTHGSDYYCGSGPVALKSDLSEYATTTALTSGLAGKANVSHTHTISQVSGLQEELNSKLESVSLADLGVTATATELNYVDGVTSNIQTQLNNKAASSHNHSAANITSGTLDLARIPSITDAKITSVSASKITGTIPQANLPSYVDDVLEYSSKSSFPKTGETGKIYVDTTTNLTYRWGGSSYVEISPSLALGETSSTAFRGDRGKIAYDHSQATGNPHNLTLSNLGISATAAELNFVDGVTSNIQTQLNAKANTSALASYALKNGSNASGTWPISVSGTAADASKLGGIYSDDYMSHFRQSGVNIDTYATMSPKIIEVSEAAGTKPLSSLWLQVMQWGSNDPDYGFQMANRYSEHGSVFFRQKVGSNWGGWKTLLDTANYTNYTVTKTGGGASGTWNINISGAAASANSVAWNNVSGKPSTFTPAAHTHSQYLTSSSLSGYATQSWVNSQGFIRTAYTLPTASASTLGGVKIGSGVTISSGVISVSCSSIGAATSGHTHSNYLTSASLSGYAKESWCNTQFTTTSEVNALISSALSGYSKTDTKNTAGSTHSVSKLFLIGAPSQAANPVTYSNSSVYAQNGQLYATQMNATNGFFETSDARLKNFKEDIKALEVVSEIPTKYFTWKSDKSKTEHIGTSAQEIQKIYPDLVTENEDGVLSVDYARLSIIALAAIKELKAQIDELKSKIN